MPDGLLLALAALGVALGAAASARVRRMRRAGAPHATLAGGLTAGGLVATAVALLVSAARWATAATPRFYTAMLLGIGLGALLAALYLDAVDRRA